MNREPAAGIPAMPPAAGPEPFAQAAWEADLPTPTPADPEYDAKMAAIRAEADALLERRRKHDADPLYPHQSGDHTIIGPECFTDENAAAIMYKGQCYTLQLDKAPSTRAMELELNVTADTGVIVPCRFVIEYPDGHGFYAVKGLQQIQPEHLNPLWQELVRRQDAATMKVMLESGHMRGEDDEDHG